MFEKTKSFIGCLFLEVREMAEKMKQQGVPLEEIIQAIGLWLEKEDPSLLVRISSTAVCLSTPAMAEAGWEIYIQIEEEVKKMAACPECAAEIVIGDMIRGEIVLCPECGVELEIVSLDPPALGLAPQEQEDWGE